MKKRFLAYSTGLIKKYYPDTDSIKMEEYAYNLEAFYLTVTKMLVIIPTAIILGVIKELLLLLLFFNILREQAHGLHATKSWICLVSSTLIFVGVPFISKIITIPFIIKIILDIIGLLLIALYAPADTVKAPIIKAERRKKYKIKSIIYTIFLIILSLIIKNTVVTNLIIFAIWIEVFLILPITYKIFHLSYNNYIEYLKNMN